MSILRNWLEGFTPLKADKQSVKGKKFLTGFTPLHPESPAFQSGDEWQIKIRSSRKPRPSGRGVTGFTLVEISVVVAILAAAGAAAVVSYSSLPGLKLEAEVRRVLSDIYWTRQRAIATNVGHALYFNQADKKYYIYKSTTAFNSTNLLKEVTLGISLSLANTNLYVYAPKGNMYLDQTSIQFNNQGKTKNIRVFAETGNVKLE